MLGITEQKLGTWRFRKPPRLHCGRPRCEPVYLWKERALLGRFCLLMGATQWLAGKLVPALLALKLADSLASVSEPTAQRDDVFARAEAAAWQETGEAYRSLAPDTELCVGHADLLASTIFHHLLPPTIVDLVPTAALRPRGYTCALVIVDGMIAGAVDDSICDRFAHIRDIDQLLLRAVAYRRHVNNLHPEAKANTRSHINRVEDLLVSRAYAML